MVSKECSVHAIMLSMDNFGKWLIDLLEDKGLSQSELARRSGLSRGTLSNIISGTRGRGPDSIEAIARALKMPPEVVFRAAGLLPPKPHEDPWVEEMSYKINQLPPGFRGIVSSFIDSLLEGSENNQKLKTKPKQKSSASQ